MSEFCKQIIKKEARLDLAIIKLQVTVGLFLSNNVVIEKGEREANSYVTELRKWAKSKDIKLVIEDVRRPIYIKGHTVYRLEGTIPYKLMTFSK